MAEVELLAIAEAARLMSVSPATVRRLVDRGHLSACRPSPSGRSLRIPRASLERWIERRTSEGMIDDDLSDLGHGLDRVLRSPCAPSRA